ncbi:glycoside hydrolase family 32 protein [Olsenella umbonata]|uniref:Sucrose-6-phosphate hydrolase n=1 Tax=Parafannyhessea umbonata TaxID=604330 RepID=A0A7X9Y0D8_9ACTN|nr:glycoside hydrolase family 32 protein [Parafannyhessea umbonata]NMF25694.1 glycoside hydrolase family 32 protein [Parafannyhessea umbonata]
MSNALERDLDALRIGAEGAARHGRYAQGFHLMPPVGWLNDPNGLCQVDGTFHAFFQYAPFNVDGGVKMWGHSTSDDLLTWDYHGVTLYPDQPSDCSGVYSGSALVREVGGRRRMELFYTGNVKLEDADGYDYVRTGREANTVWVTTEDGDAHGPKRVVMRNADYPADDTCHVRDPKVWEGDGRYLMVQGARRDDDWGEVLVFGSDDLARWELLNRVTTPTRFGYMWECPDYFELSDGKGGSAKVLSVSPQGLEGGDWDRRNVYQSGYFMLEGDVAGSCELGDFALWDAGFDFYAPQTFAAEDGRRILIGWMGIPDEPTYGNDPTVAAGWQHCFTIPREVTLAGGRVRQAPVRELDARRADAARSVGGALDVEGRTAFDLVLDASTCTAGVRVTLSDELALTWRDSRLSMAFGRTARSDAGCGRTERWEPLPELRNLRVVGDASSVEVFANDGELCMSTRYYPRRYRVQVDAPGADATLWGLEA